MTLTYKIAYRDLAVGGVQEDLQHFELTLIDGRADACANNLVCVARFPIESKVAHQEQAQRGDLSVGPRPTQQVQWNVGIFC